MKNQRDRVTFKDVIDRILGETFALAWILLFFYGWYEITRWITQAIINKSYGM